MVLRADSAPGPPDSRPLESIVVLQGPGIVVDERTLAGDCEEAEAQLSVPIEVIACGTGESFVSALRESLARNRGIVADPGGLARNADVAAAMAIDHPALIWVSLHAGEPRVLATPELATRSIVGRGVDSYRFAIRTVAARAAWPFTIHRYGTEPAQFGQLRLPRAGGRAHPVVALLHGGGWREHWGLDVTERIAVDLARRGHATWNLEFRRLGQTPWPAWHALLDDVAAGIDHLKPLASSQPLDLERVVVLGHSSGGHLALWVAIRDRLPGDSPGASPVVTPALCVSLAGLGELEEFAARGLDAGSAAALVGGSPEEVPERYAVASPACHPRGRVPQLLVHGEAEECRDLNDLARVYERKMRAAGGDVRLVELPATRHFDFLDPESSGWRRIVEELSARASRRGDVRIA